MAREPRSLVQPAADRANAARISNRAAIGSAAVLRYGGPVSRLPVPALEHLADISVKVDRPVEVGDTGAGIRRLIPILGGTVEGPRLRGRVLPGGADFQLVRSATVAELDARYALELDDGRRVYVVNRALRRASAEDVVKLVRGEAVDPARVYFRCTPSFEVADESLRWLADSVFVGTGARFPDSVELSFFRVL